MVEKVFAQEEKKGYVQRKKGFLTDWAFPSPPPPPDVNSNRKIKKGANEEKRHLPPRIQTSSSAGSQRSDSVLPLGSRGKLLNAQSSVLLLSASKWPVLLHTARCSQGRKKASVLFTQISLPSSCCGWITRATSKKWMNN